MPEFVGDNATQNDRALELVAVPLGSPQLVIMVDDGEDGNDGKTKNSILKLVLRCLRKYSQHEPRTKLLIFSARGKMYELQNRTTGTYFERGDFAESGIEG